MTTAFETYITKVETDYRGGKATEHTYRSSLEALREAQDRGIEDRKGRVLSGEDITHYQRVVVALNETIRLMGEIDNLIPTWPIQ